MEDERGFCSSDCKGSFGRRSWRDCRWDMKTGASWKDGIKQVGKFAIRYLDQKDVSTI